MKYVRYTTGGPVYFGLLEDGDKTVRHIEGTPFSTYIITDTTYDIVSVRLLEPTIPSKIVAVGLNYTDHASELGMQLPEEPLIFLKASSALLGPNDSILYPDMSKQVEYEAELAIVIKDTARHVSIEQAPSHILGYTCANDVTARDLQKKDGQWTRAKSFDTFAPIGPCIATDIDPDSLAIELKLNGEIKQSSTTANMIFKTAQLVSFISHVMTLCTGDIILTGTPPGVGLMQVGDTAEVTIEGIGTLVNNVIRI